MMPPIVRKKKHAVAGHREGGFRSPGADENELDACVADGANAMVRSYRGKRSWSADVSKTAAESFAYSGGACQAVIVVERA